MPPSAASAPSGDLSEDVLRAPLVLEYPFRRTTGPVIGAFFTGLREGRLIGIKDDHGNVLVPPVEYDPMSGASLTELVPVASVGTVESWSWNDSVREGQPFDRPFAWALIKLDGADTTMLHAVDATEEQMAVGMRVQAKFADERVGTFTDLVCFEPAT